MFVATDWYYISSQSGAGSGFASGDPLIVFPVLGIAFLGISLPLLLQGAEKYKTCVKVAVALLISLSVVSATVIGVTLYAPTSGHGPWWPGFAGWGDAAAVRADDLPPAGVRPAGEWL